MSKPEPMQFVVESEPMGLYRLEDGTVLRVRTVLMKALFKGYDQNGKPLYDLAMQQCIDVEPGEHVRQENAG